MQTEQDLNESFLKKLIDIVNLMRTEFQLQFALGFILNFA